MASLTRGRVTTAECGDIYTDADGTLIVNHITCGPEGANITVELTGDGRMVHTHAFCSCRGGAFMVSTVRFAVWGRGATHGWCCPECRMVRQFG